MSTTELDRQSILISGGAGFIGVNLVNYLCNEEVPPKTIIVIDNFICSNRSSIYKIKNENRGKSNIHVIEGDICDTSVIEKIKIEFPKVHRIYHLASLASPKAYARFPIETLDVGYIGTKHMLELCKYYTHNTQQSSDVDTASCKFLYTSTSEVYGAPLEHPQKESYYGNVNCYGTRSCYDEAKRVGEALVYSYKRLFRLDTKVIRIFNTYGPYMALNDGRIVTEIIKAMLFEGTLKIYGTGDQTRSLNYVDDTVQFMQAVMDTEEEGPINIGNDEEITINQLVNACNMVYTAKFGVLPTYKLIKTAIDVDDPKLRRPDLKKLKQLLRKKNINFESKTTLAEGILKTYEYFLQNGNDSD